MFLDGKTYLWFPLISRQQKQTKCTKWAVIHLTGNPTLIDMDS